MLLLYTRQLVIYSFMLLQALRVEIEMKNVNIQVTFLVQKGVGTRSHPTTPLPKPNPQNIIPKPKAQT